MLRGTFQIILHHEGLRVVMVIKSLLDYLCWIIRMTGVKSEPRAVRFSRRNTGGIKADLRLPGTGVAAHLLEGRENVGGNVLLAETFEEPGLAHRGQRLRPDR
jgi:hypothetical protein